MPFFETPEDALKSCVQALGGAKSVAPAMWPDKTIENARDYLLACLNPDRNEKLSYTQVIHIFRLAKNVGFHAGFEWFSQACEYDSKPVSIDDQRDRTTQIIANVAETLERALKTLSDLQK